MTLPISDASRQADDERSVAHWGVFICYRQVDGRSAAAWLYESLHENQLTFTPEGHDEPPTLDVYFDQTAPAVDDWTRLHEPALRRARALLFVSSPGAFANHGPNDWVHRELQWWLANRAAAPILIDPTGEGSRWIPDSVKSKWPNAQQLILQPERLANLPATEQNRQRATLRERILAGIREASSARPTKISSGRGSGRAFSNNKPMR